MPTEVVSKLKVGDRFLANCHRDAINYSTYAKITKIEPIRAYNSVNPGTQLVVAKIFFKPEKGPLAGEELDVLVEDTKKVTTPPKPGKFRQIMNILFT